MICIDFIIYYLLSIKVRLNNNEIFSALSVHCSVIYLVAAINEEKQLTHSKRIRFASCVSVMGGLNTVCNGKSVNKYRRPFATCLILFHAEERKNHQHLDTVLHILFLFVVLYSASVGSCPTL